VKSFIKNQPHIFLLVAAVLWLGLYKTLEPLSHLLVGALPIERASPSCLGENDSGDKEFCQVEPKMRIDHVL